MKQLIAALYIGIIVISVLPVCSLGVGDGDTVNAHGRNRQLNREPNQETQQVGLIINEKGACAGYTLFTPISSTSTYLIDMEGRLVNQWQSDCRPGQSVYLLEDGHLLRTGTGNNPGNQTFHSGGTGGRVQKFTWEGELVWDYQYCDDQHCLHHDIEPMANGNVLMIAWELKSKKEAIAAGRDPELVSDEGLWPDHVIEVKPTGKTTGEIVWQWHVWDHLIQDLDPRRANRGVVEDHPELIDINYTKIGGPGMEPQQWQKLRSLGYISGGPAKTGSSNGPGDRRGKADWNHTNSISYNAEFDQIVLSVHEFSELWVIDHSTTTKEAAGHTGGKQGKGGDILYRWGNPKAYRAGDESDQQLFSQHDVSWIASQLPDAGNLLIFNNGNRRPDGEYSTIDEIVLPVNQEGQYASVKGMAWKPAKPAWTYTAKPKKDFYSSHISGAQRLANGNTLICSGEQGRFFEVTPLGKTVWEYINPVINQGHDFGPPMGPPGIRGSGMRGPGMRPGQRGGPGMRGPGMRPDQRGGPGMQRPGMGPDQMGRRGNRGRRPDMQGPGPGGPGMGGPGGGGPGNSVFNIYRYAPDYPGLAGKDLSSGKLLEEIITEQSQKPLP
ncbi:MAG: aryl-sulfate sulfotransferase [Sedimentisphaerales bacterium]|nr:aryl-sulfate sulfotransferase [Sedimentisphaerales bacterium]